MKSTVINYLDKFASTTVIRGFSFIKISNSWVERFFWIFLVVSFTGLTVRGVVDSIKRYSEEPTTSRTTIRKNSSIFFPNPIVCLQLDFNSIKFKINLADTAGIDKLLASYRHQNITNIFSEQLRSYESSKTALKSKFTNSSQMLATLNSYDSSMANKSDNFLSLVYAICMVLMNIQRLGTSYQLRGVVVDPHRNNWGLIDPETKLVMNSTSLSLFRISQFLTKQGADYLLLIKQIAVIFCNQLNVKLFRAESQPLFPESDLTVEFPCSTENIVGFGENQLQAGVSMLFLIINKSEIFHWKKTDTKAGLAFKTKNFYADDYDVNGLFVLLDFNECFGGKNMEYLLSSVQGLSVTATSVINGFYKSVSLKRRPCDKSTSFVQCFQSCIDSQIQKRCKCRPVSAVVVDKKFTSEPVCGTYVNDSYEGVDLNVPYLTEGDCANLTLYGMGPDCFINCPERCNALIMSHQVNYFQWNSSLDFGYNTILIEKILTFTFPEVEERFAMDFTDLITRLGGNLSLWLNASFLALIHIFIFFMKIPFEICSKSHTRQR